MSSSRTTDATADEEKAAGSKTEESATASEDETGESTDSEQEAGTDGDEAPGEATATTDADKGVGEESDETERGDGSRVAAGAAAVVSAGLGVASLTGTWLSDLMASRQGVIGQIESQTAPPTPSEQVATIYGTPWHTTALFNGFFALAAIILAGAALVILVLSKGGARSATWVRAVAFGGLLLGTIGLVIAGLMWFDVFTELPTVPEVQAPPPGIPGG